MDPGIALFPSSLAGSENEIIQLVAVRSWRIRRRRDRGVDDDRPSLVHGVKPAGPGLWARPGGLVEQTLERVGEQVHQDRGLVGRVANLFGAFDGASQRIDGLPGRGEELIGVVELTLLQRGDSLGPS